MNRRTGAIRAYVVGVLEAAPGLPDTVSEGRVYPAQIGLDVPDLNVATFEDTYTDRIYDKATQRYIEGRELACVVEARVRGDDFLAQADELGFQIQAAVMADETFGGLTENVRCESSSVDPASDLEDPSAVIAWDFRILYRVHAHDPQ